MILVTLGTQNNSFHRLLEEVQKNIDNGKTPDLYPVLDNNSGTVYFPSEAYYSNFDKLLEEFDRNENGSFIIRTYDDLVKLANLVDNNYSQYGKENYILENNMIWQKR